MIHLQKITTKKAMISTTVFFAQICISKMSVENVSNQFIFLSFKTNLIITNFEYEMCCLKRLFKRHRGSVKDSTATTTLPLKTATSQTNTVETTVEKRQRQLTVRKNGTLSVTVFPTKFRLNYNFRKMQ